MHNGKNILAQGHMDGACFLYSLANAVAALTGKSVTRRQWQRSVSSLDFRLDDFLAGPGTAQFEDDPDSLLALSQAFLSHLKVPITMSLANKIGSIAALGRALTPKSKQVVIACINHAEHWVVVVDVKGDEVFVACSAAALWGKTPYVEAKSPRLARMYNVVRTFPELKIWQGHNFLLTHNQ